MRNLYRESFEPNRLLREYPPRMGNPHKVMLFDMAYQNTTASSGEVEVTRWGQDVPEPISLPAKLESAMIPRFYDYAHANVPGEMHWHVNFADPRLFGAYGSGLLAQDEMQVAEHPVLGCVREALLARSPATARTVDETGATPVLVRDVERRIEIATEPNIPEGRPMGLYGNRFAVAPAEVVRRAVRKIDPPTHSNLIAMAAPSGGAGDYTEHQIEHIFSTAYTAFAAAVHESIRASGPATQTVIHTGFWGCGAFGGNRRLMTALQALAARAANVSQMMFYSGDVAGAQDAASGLDVAESVAFRCGKTCTLDTLVGRCVILGYRWGISDGN